MPPPPEAGGVCGSHLVPPGGTAALYGDGAAPQVTISYTVANPPSAAITTPPEGESYTYGQSVNASSLLHGGRGRDA